MKSNGSKTFFISAFKNNLTAAENLDRHSALRHSITKLGYIKDEGIGCFNNNPELTILVNTNLTNAEEDFISLMKQYNQECVLIVHGIDSAAQLLYPDGTTKTIGKMKCIGGEDGVTTEPLRGRDYTYVNEKYYIVE